jgi:anti-sigma regulatory factor (Ser/Thr protein kinase)
MKNFALDINYISQSHENVIEECAKMVTQFENEPETKLTIDFSNCDFLYPDYALIVLCAIKFIESEGIEVHGKIKLDKNTLIYNFLLKIDFFKNLKIQLPKIKNDIKDNSFIEIQNYTSGNQLQVLHKIVKLLKEKSKMDDNVFTGLDYCLNEILDNILNHSKEKEGWVVAQYFNKLNQIRLMIVDHGIGIQQALNEKYNFTGEEALKNCIVSGVTNGRGQGHGLFATSLFAKENKGWLSIISGSNKLDVSESKTSISEIKFWQGTCVYLRINTNIEVDYKLFTSDKFDQKQALFEMLFE